MIHNTFLFKGKKINYQDEGQGDNALVLLHGFMGTLDFWASFVFSYMRENMRVIAVDLIGHGESEAVGDVFTMELQADMLKALLDHVGVTRCVMVGHSMGGYITLSFAEKYPFYLRGFGLIHSQALADTAQGKINRERMCNAIVENRSGFIVQFMHELFAPCNRERLNSEIQDSKNIALEMNEHCIIAAQKGMIARPSRVHVLKDSGLPVLFIYGKQDPCIPIDTAMAQAMIPKHSEILLLDNVGHMSPLEARDIVKEKLRYFLRVCNL